MRLQTIKLAGFKSFVDPTTVVFNSDIAAVVGPNGCGKSNIVDAVRWVIGESSARTLRGDLISDVIFNGTDNRRSASRASVELLFDNRDGRFGGEFASYSQIELRREISVDHQSVYYINGSRCRRRDIQDLFLGTGFGTRGYAIIEQGIVSQLVQSSPEELREYLEEAAGVSKYRARRHETELKINRTKENLLRVEDQLIELKRQISLLKRQARAAQRHQRYTEDYRLHLALLSNIRRSFKREELTGLEQELAQLEQECTRIETIKTTRETEMVDLQEQSQSFVELRDLETAKSYEINSEISALEVALKTDEARTVEIGESIQSGNSRMSDLREQIEGDADTTSRLTNTRRELREESASVSDLLPDLEQKTLAVRRNFLESQSDREKFLSRYSDVIRERDLTEEQKRHSTKLLEDLRKRLDALESNETEEEFDGTNIDSLRSSVDQRQSHYEKLNSRSSKLEASLASVETNIASLEGQVADKSGREQELNSLVTSLSAQLDAVEAPIDKTNGVSDWLKRNRLDDAAVLRDGLKVADGWEHAVEMVLGLDLHALVLQEPLSDQTDFATLSHGSISIIESGTALASGGALTPISRYVQFQDAQFDGFLEHVYCVDTLNQAFEVRSQLEDHQSVVTRDGFWLGKRWVRVNRLADQQKGVLEVSRDLAAARTEHEAVNSEVVPLRNSLDAQKQELVNLRSERDDLQREINRVFGELTQEKGDLKIVEMRLEALVHQRVRHDQDLRDIRQRIENEEHVLAGALSELEKKENLKRELDSVRDRLNANHADLRKEMDSLEESYAKAKDANHAHELKLQAIDAELKNVRLLQDGRTAEIGGIEVELSELKAQRAKLLETTPSKQANLNELLSQRVKIEEKQRGFQRQIDNLQEEQRTASQRLSEIGQSIDSNRKQREGKTVEIAVIKSNIENLDEQIQNTGVTAEQIEDAQSPELTVELVENKIQRIQRQIERIGDINQTAERELESRSKEKEFLESQVDDLDQALETLEAAITRIDGETRRLLNATFDEVNENLAEIFPKLFGGGVATLEFTGTSILDAGVLMRAHPPGKRNLSIKLLSGGEKAMAAIAFVFSVFKLNPSPVCVLDEVDAPLDEQNVGRFVDLLVNMTDETQFIVVTHNSRTMETAQELIGITMEEPGISRVVSVNLDEAIASADAVIEEIAS